MIQNVSARASRVILATTAGFSPESGPPVSIADRSAPFAPQGRRTFSFFPPPRLLNWRSFGRVCGAVPRPRPFSRAWIGSRATVERAIRLIVEDGALDEKGASVEKLAERLGMGRRQLDRLFARHLKASPSAVARTARVQRAKRLIDETDKSMMEIAVLAGFGSLRRAKLIQTARRTRIKYLLRLRLRFYRCVPTTASSVFTQPRPVAEVGALLIRSPRRQRRVARAAR
jgi:AraC-like DNA-binding protein